MQHGIQHLLVRSYKDAYKLRLYLVIPAFVLSAFMVATISLSGVASGAPHEPDPFVQFHDILPGQSASALERRGFSRTLPTYTFTNDLSEKYYAYVPSGGMFSEIRAEVNKGRIYHVDFMLRDHSLSLGDLAGILGMYDYRVLANEAFFLMSDHVVIAKTVAGSDRVTPFVSVMSVTFADN